MGHPPKSATATSYPRLRVQRYVCLAYAALLTYVSLAPGQRIPGIFDWGRLFSPDKVAHFGAYAIFAVLLSFSIRTTSRWKLAVTAAAAAALFGAIMEVLQGIAGTGRDFDPVDMVANLIGAILGGAFYLALPQSMKQYFTAVKS
ncbi:VanZ family protein [Lewinella sp. JB7]|uniref:VanZ family protein n=1 Tax=Lewinella sp. JB7 TaxID=2962887 RepID=UPI0020C9A4F3|nr:VanZ family protein [Lewinella sp. JB7]MCP9234561.1 VanZ family protein [Lewinella sp. JB7]